jgi:hypothetical protein
MTNLSSLTQLILEEAGYRTWLVSIDNLSAIGFEDEAVMGFVCEFDDPETLLSRWHAVETGLLTRHAPFLREAGQKAWNVYSVFLCTKSLDDVSRRRVAFIEEDLERTRKIAASGLVGRQDVITALLPLLAIQYRPSMDREDLVDRLRKRVDTIAPGVSTAVVDASIDPRDVVALLHDQT